MNNWWEYDPEGLQEKLELLNKKFRTKEETERMYSRDKASKERRVTFKAQQKLIF